MSFASRLRQAREQAGFTQQDLAKKLGVTKNAISNYENGVSSPKWEILVEIFDILHVDPNFLYQDDFSSELAEAHVLTPQQSTLLAAFDQLNEEGQIKAVEYFVVLICKVLSQLSNQRCRNHVVVIHSIWNIPCHRKSVDLLCHCFAYALPGNFQHLVRQSEIAYQHWLSFIGSKHQLCLSDSLLCKFNGFGMQKVFYIFIQWA